VSRVVTILLVLTVSCAACGGTGASSAAALAVSRSSVDSFFSTHDGGRWLPGPTTSSYVSEDGTAMSNACLVILTRPMNSTEVSVIGVDCTLGEPPYLTAQAATTFLTSLVQRFVPSGARWAQQSLSTDIGGVYVAHASASKTFDGARLKVGTSTSYPRMATLSIAATGFHDQTSSH